VAGIVVSLGFSKGAFSHISGYYTGINNLVMGNIFGYGIGNAGNLSDTNIEGGGESGMGGMLVQTGIAALFYLAFFYTLIHYLEYDIKANQTAIILIIAWAFIFVFSESSLGISGNILFWVYPGICLYKTVHNKRH
jgi:hypothetical protein